jgi:hypothetical protein
MTEVNWISMPGVPLITAGNPETTAGEEGNVIDAPGNGARAAKETTGPTSDEARVNRATGLSDEVERIEAAVGTVSPAPASPGVVAVPEVDAAPAPDEAALSPSTPERTLEATVVWTSLGPLPRWVPGPTTRWAPGTTWLALHGT